VPISTDDCELKALATEEKARHQGIATAMIRHLAETYRERYATIVVGTTDPGVSFYEKSGFVRFRTLKDFFVENYPSPVYDGDFLSAGTGSAKKPALNGFGRHPKNGPVTPGRTHHERIVRGSNRY